MNTLSIPYYVYILYMCYMICIYLLLRGVINCSMYSKGLAQYVEIKAYQANMASMPMVKGDS